MFPALTCNSQISTLTSRFKQEGQKSPNSAAQELYRLLSKQHLANDVLAYSDVDFSGIWRSVTADRPARQQEDVVSKFESSSYAERVELVLDEVHQLLVSDNTNASIGIYKRPSCVLLDHPTFQDHVGAILPLAVALCKPFIELPLLVKTLAKVKGGDVLLRRVICSQPSCFSRAVDSLLGLAEQQLQLDSDYVASQKKTIEGTARMLLTLSKLSLSSAYSIRRHLLASQEGLAPPAALPCAISSSSQVEIKAFGPLGFWLPSLVLRLTLESIKDEVEFLLYVFGVGRNQEVKAETNNYTCLSEQVACQSVQQYLYHWRRLPSEAENHSTASQLFAPSPSICTDTVATIAPTTTYLDTTAKMIISNLYTPTSLSSNKPQDSSAVTATPAHPRDYLVWSLLERGSKEESIPELARLVRLFCCLVGISGMHLSTREITHVVHIWTRVTGDDGAPNTLTGALKCPDLMRTKQCQNLLEVVFSFIFLCPNLLASLGKKSVLVCLNSLLSAQQMPIPERVQVLLVCCHTKDGQQAADIVRSMVGFPVQMVWSTFSELASLVTRSVINPKQLCNVVLDHLCTSPERPVSSASSALIRTDNTRFYHFTCVHELLKARILSSLYPNIPLSQWILTVLTSPPSPLPFSLLPILQACALVCVQRCARMPPNELTQLLLPPEKAVRLLTLPGMFTFVTIYHENIFFIIAHVH